MPELTPMQERDEEIRRLRERLAAMESPRGLGLSEFARAQLVYGATVLATLALAAGAVWYATTHDVDYFLYVDGFWRAVTGMALLYVFTELATPHFRTLDEIKKSPVGIAIWCLAVAIVLASAFFPR